MYTQYITGRRVHNLSITDFSLGLFLLFRVQLLRKEIRTTSLDLDEVLRLRFCHLYVKMRVPFLSAFDGLQERMQSGRFTVQVLGLPASFGGEGMAASDCGETPDLGRMSQYCAQRTVGKIMRSS